MKGEPVDLDRCQAEFRKADPFRFGIPPLERCANVPVVIATERDADAEGDRGSMSLCSKCWDTFQARPPRPATFQLIERSGDALAE